MSHMNTTPATPVKNIRIVDSTITAISADSSFAMMGSDSKTSSADPDPIVHRKLRRRKGDRRAKMESSMLFSSVSAGTTALLLLIVLLLQTMGMEEVDAAAYLNGATNPNNSKLPKASTSASVSAPLPITTTTAAAAAKKQRYTFLKTPRNDRHFTSTGILPPLSPASDPDREAQNLLLPLPPRNPQHRSTKNTKNNNNNIEASEPPIRVTYTNDPKTVDEWLCRNVPYDGCFLGFDIERLPECRSEHPNARDRSAFGHAAVVQLATPSSCLVVHLVKGGSSSSSSSAPGIGGGAGTLNHPTHSNACAKILRSVLEDPTVIKAGCSIDEDLVLLHELWGNSSSGGNSNSNANKNLKKKAEKGQQQKATNHPAAKSKRRKGGATKTTSGGRTSNAHGPSLQARSRFDLGCVVLPRDCTSTNKTNDPSNHHQYRMIAKRTTNTINNKSGLQGLCKSILGVDLPKEKENSASDWTRFPLTDDQITYAARDAWAGAAIATKLASLNVDDGSWISDASSPSSAFGAGGNARQKSKSNSNNVFSRSNLLKVLKRAETPMSELAQRHRQRKEAKTELQTLLDKYFLNQQHFRDQELHQQKIALVQGSSNSNNISNSTYSNNNIDVEALFASCPLTRRRTLVNYAQKQRQLLEKSLPKKIRKRSIVLRQAVNAKVIDHKVVFEIDLIHPNTENEHEPKHKNQRAPPQDDYRARKRRHRND
jgi:hypothetical protein